jgi:hypothetical protein
MGFNPAIAAAAAAKQKVVVTSSRVASAPLPVLFDSASIIVRDAGIFEPSRIVRDANNNKVQAIDESGAPSFDKNGHPIYATVKTGASYPMIEYHLAPFKGDGKRLSRDQFFGLVRAITAPDAAPFVAWVATLTQHTPATAGKRK